MSATSWLRDRSAGVPGALSATLHNGVDGSDGRTVSDLMMEAARRQLSRVLEANPMTRAQALDLLAADAFATYALEAAADEPETLAARADAAMRMFADDGTAPQ
jgi:hypothetical protein